MAGLQDSRYAEVVGDIYEAAYRPEHWIEALRKISLLCGSDSATLLYRDNELERASGLHYWNISSEAMAEYAQLDRDPLYELLLESVPIGIAMAAQKRIPDRRELENYYGKGFTNLARKYDLYDICSVILFNDDIRAFGFALQRKQSTGAWTDEEVEILTELSPHLQRAMHIHKEFTRLRLREQALRAGLDKLLMGLILFDDMLQPVYCNPVAESILDYHPAISLRNDRLCAHKPEDTEVLHKGLLRAIQTASDDGNRHTALGLKHPDTSTPLPLIVMPIGESNLGLSPDEGLAHAAVMFSDPDRNQPIVPEALRTAYGLTLTEAQVAIAMTNGLNIDDITAMHGTKQSTVKSQVLSVYRKLGISRQAELVKILLTGPFRVQF